MPPEDNNPTESNPTESNSNHSNASDRTAGYEYSATDSEENSEQNSEQSLARSSDSKPPNQGSVRRKPLGLQRSDRSGQRTRLSSSSSLGSQSSDGRSPGSTSPGSTSPSSTPLSSTSLSSTPLGSRSTSTSSASTSGAQADIAQLVRQGLREMESRKQALQKEIAQLEQRKERLETEMKSSFAGASQDVAIRVQSFKNYLVGSLQDLATTAEEMNLVPAAMPAQPPSAPERSTQRQEEDTVSLAAQRFAQQRDRINSLLDQYRTRPDYYGPPWQLRRTFEPIHAERTSNWFFTQGGRGAVKSMGSRLQNVLVASAAISCMHAIYDRRLCVLVLATTPERLGEWRRWLQDCLGISRADFGTNRGVMLFEDTLPMSQRAERLMDSGRIPFLIMDEAEEKVSLSLLQYPLWLGFAPDPANPSTDYDYY